MVEMRFETSDAAAAAAASKKVHTLDQTRVIPQGVKTFVTFVIIVGALLVGALIYVLVMAN
jgi:hypothetical protein